MFNNAIEYKLYADDLKLYSEIVAEADHLILQHGIDDLVFWSNKCQLTISFKECFSMQVNRSNTIPEPKYSLDDCLLPNLISAKDLGITIDNKLNFNAYMPINNVLCFLGKVDLLLRHSC